MNRFPTSEESIKDFKEGFEWIIYDLDIYYNLSKDEQGNFYVNKLYIEPNYLTYKTECYKLEQGLFEKVEKLWELLNDKK